VDVSTTDARLVVSGGNVRSPTTIVWTCVPEVAIEVVTVRVTDSSALMVWAVVTVVVGILVVVVVVVSAAPGPGVVVVVTTGGPTVTLGGGGGLPVDDVDDVFVTGVSGTVVSEIGSPLTVTRVRTVPVVTVEVVTVFVIEPSGLMACVVVTVVVGVLVVVTVVTVVRNVVVVIVTTEGPTVTVGGDGLPVDEVEEVLVTGRRALVLGGNLRPPMVTTLVTVPAIAVVVVTIVLMVPLGAATCDVATVVVGVLVVVVVTVLRPDRVVSVVTTGAPTVTTGNDEGEVAEV
jgi:hypothetical protein